MSSACDAGCDAVVSSDTLDTALRRALSGAALLLLAACGGGGGKTPTPPPVVVPETPDVLAVASGTAIQSQLGQSLLAFRPALLSSATYPVGMNFTIVGATGGASCAAGVDYVVATAANVSATPGASTSGRITLDAGSVNRQISLLVCPGTGGVDKPITFNWNDGAASGAASGLIRASGSTTLALSKRINDTGVLSCATLTAVGLPCPQPGFAGQDAETGRDSTAGVTGQGAYRGSARLLTSLANGACLQDNVTGLVWENKTGAGLHDSAATYTWRSALGNGGSAGTAAGGVCTGSTCDTDGLVAAVNAERLCGFDDWRLPLADELSGIVDSGASSAPTIAAQFSGQAAAPYWSASPKAGDSAGAWAVDFNSGAVVAQAKSSANRVRLVRGR